jgi:hypothetical protein
MIDAPWFEKFEEQEVEDSEQLLWLKASVSLNFVPIMCLITSFHMLALILMCPIKVCLVFNINHSLTTWVTFMLGSSCLAAILWVVVVIMNINNEHAFLYVIFLVA